MLSQRQTELLLSGRAISEDHPWKSNDDGLTKDFYRGVIVEVENATGCKSRIEWDHYGSGYASYIDAWFYKDESGFLPKKHAKYGEHYVGLIVLLSRLSPYFVFMEGEKQWHSHGGSGYLPDHSMVDRLESLGPMALAGDVESVLLKHGLLRLHSQDLEASLSPDVRISTNLSEGPYRNFDALYYWYD